MNAESDKDDLLNRFFIAERNPAMYNIERHFCDPNLLNNGFAEERVSARSLVWSRTSACHADDPGSNLGARTTSLSHATHAENFLACLMWFLRATGHVMFWFLIYIGS